MADKTLEERALYAIRTGDTSGLSAAELQIVTAQERQRSTNQGTVQAGESWADLNGATWTQETGLVLKADQDIAAAKQAHADRESELDAADPYRAHYRRLANEQRKG